MDKPTHIPVKFVIPADQLFGDDEQDTRLLRQMAKRAAAFLQDFNWCKSIRESYFGDGYGGIVAIFLFRIDPIGPEIDEWLWVIVGDIPPAYLVIDKSNTPSLALEGYIEEMSKWVQLAKKGKSSKKVIPVNVPATPDNAKLLEERLNIFTEILVPAFRQSEIEIA